MVETLVPMPQCLTPVFFPVLVTPVFDAEGGNMPVFTPPATFEDNTRRVIQDLNGVSFTMDDGASLASVSAVKAGIVPDAMQKSVSRFMDRPHVLRLAVESASRRAKEMCTMRDSGAHIYASRHLDAMFYLKGRVMYREVDSDAAPNWLSWYSLEMYLRLKIVEAANLIGSFSVSG